MIVGGGSFVAFHRDREARLAEADRLVGEALATAEADRHEAERDGPGATESWAARKAAADNARATLAGLVGAPSPCAAAWTRRSPPPAAGPLAARERDRARPSSNSSDAWARPILGASLRDDARPGRSSARGTPRPSVPPASPSAATPPEIAEKLAQADQVAEIAGFLDDWARDADSAIRGDLVAVAEAIDPAGNPLRLALREGDAESLAQMARSAPAQPMSPARRGPGRRPHRPGEGRRGGAAAEGGSLAMAERLLAQRGARPRIARRLPPGAGPRPRPGRATPAPSTAPGPDAVGALRYLTAAVALRPDSPTAHVNLACAWSYWAN